MTEASTQLVALRKYYPDVDVWNEGGRKIVFIPRLKIDLPNGPVEFSAVLYPYARDGYSTRLFVDRKVSAPNAKNWTSHSVGGETWWACSWKDVPGTLPWVEILASHLQAFQ